MYKEMGLALYRFNIKKHRGLYLDVSSGPKKKCNLAILHFLKCKRCRRHDVSKVYV
jgi:hypothetical protein